MKLFYPIVIIIKTNVLILFIPFKIWYVSRQIHKIKVVRIDIKRLAETNNTHQKYSKDESILKTITKTLIDLQEKRAREVHHKTIEQQDTEHKPGGTIVIIKFPISTKVIDNRQNNQSLDKWNQFIIRGRYYTKFTDIISY